MVSAESWEHLPGIKLQIPYPGPHIWALQPKTCSFSTLELAAAAAASGTAPAAAPLPGSCLIPSAPPRAARRRNEAGKPPRFWKCPCSGGQTWSWERAQGQGGQPCLRAGIRIPACSCVSGCTENVNQAQKRLSGCAGRAGGAEPLSRCQHPAHQTWHSGKLLPSPGQPGSTGHPFPLPAAFPKGYRSLLSQIPPPGPPACPAAAPVALRQEPPPRVRLA